MPVFFPRGATPAPAAGTVPGALLSGARDELTAPASPIGARPFRLPAVWQGGSVEGRAMAARRPSRAPSPVSASARGILAAGAERVGVAIGLDQLDRVAIQEAGTDERDDERELPARAPHDAAARAVRIQAAE